MAGPDPLPASPLPQGCVTSGPPAPSLGLFRGGMKMLDRPIQFAEWAFLKQKNKQNKKTLFLYLPGGGGRGL